MALAKGGPLLSRVENLIPTQARVGFQEVERKTEKIKSFSKKERHEYLSNNPVPVVVGPGGSLYIVDHHHLARAVLEAGHSKIYISVLEDYSHLSEISFWSIMKSRRWVYLQDDVKEKSLTPLELPRRIQDMGDDPFRSLAGQLRRAQGFFKSERDFFIEFVWARQLRMYFEKQGYSLRNNWREKDLERALDFASSNEARHLPGSLGASKCVNLFL